jgi:hypothetical protein
MASPFVAPLRSRLVTLAPLRESNHYALTEQKCN